MAFNEDFLLELKERNPIEDVVSSYINIKKGGAIPRDFAPFTTKKRPPSRFIPKTAHFIVSAAERAGTLYGSFGLSKISTMSMP